MLKSVQAPATLRILGVAVAVIQLFDILIHATTNQLEPLRVSSNIIILVWLAVVATGKFGAKFLPTAASAIGAYLVLNVIFLALEGATNDGELRLTLFLLVALTLALSSLLVYLLGRHRQAVLQSDL